MKTDHRRSVIYSQNFLTDRRLASRLMDTSSIGANDLVIEIGPGKGILTSVLAERCRQVLAIEKDPQLARQLVRYLHHLDNVVIFEADATNLPLPLTPYTVFANIPFNVTAQIVTMLTDTLNPPIEASLVMQREAAERYIGVGKQTLVSVLLHPWFELSITYRFRQDDFVPPPRVDVVMLRFSKRGPPLVSDDERQSFRDVVVYGFTAWKPTLAAAFGDVCSCDQLRRIAACSGLDLSRKPSMVSPDRWLRFYRCFSELTSPRQRQPIHGAEGRLRTQQEKLDKIHRTRTRPRDDTARR